MPEEKISEYSDDIILVGIDYIGGDEFTEEMEEIVNRYDPAHVGLALCEKRFETLDGKKEWLDQSLLPSYKAGKTGILIYQAFIDALFENFRRFRGMEPESHIADLVPMIDRLDTDIEFLDRDITLTLSRAYRSMSILEKFKMIWYFKSAMLTFSSEKKERSVEGLEEHDDLVGGVIENLSMFAPSVADKTKSERLEYMGKKIHELSKDGTTVAVIPQSLVEEVRKELNKIKREEFVKGKHSGIEHLEEFGKKVFSKVLRFASPAFFITLAVYLFFFSDVMNVWRAWLYWFLAVGGMSALGSTLARGHPISILTSFILAPFMSLTLIGPGWIAGYVELKVRNPTVGDLKGVTESSSTGEFLRNNLVKVLLVGTFSNVFTWVGLFIVLPLLIKFAG